VRDNHGDDDMLTAARFFYYIVLLISLIFSSESFAGNTVNIPILCYHNFNPTIRGSMNLTPQKLDDQLKWLKDNGFTVIPLKVAVEYLQGTRPSLPKKSVVVTVDDGWQSAYTYLLPVIRKHNIPVTLFIYPEAISKGKHAMTWEEVKELQSTGLFDIQGHTYSHPNFKQERKHLSAAAYEKMVEVELVNSKKILEDKLHTPVTLLAWPFGIYDKYLEQAADKAGYTMAFSIDARAANRSFRPMAQPRFMIVDGLSMKSFISIANGATVTKN
jgi:peptidoglycan/xylan/chitin deacetylase (PgdA/CDA1 family)